MYFHDIVYMQCQCIHNSYVKYVLYSNGRFVSTVERNEWNTDAKLIVDWQDRYSMKGYCYHTSKPRQNSNLTFLKLYIFMICSII